MQEAGYTIRDAPFDEHLEMLFETGSLQDEEQYRYFISEYKKLGRKTHSFLRSVESGHLT